MLGANETQQSYLNFVRLDLAQSNKQVSKQAFKVDSPVKQTARRQSNSVGDLMFRLRGLSSSKVKNTHRVSPGKFGKVDGNTCETENETGNGRRAQHTPNRSDATTNTFIRNARRNNLFERLRKRSDGPTATYPQHLKKKLYFYGSGMVGHRDFHWTPVHHCCYCSRQICRLSLI